MQPGPCGPPITEHATMLSPTTITRLGAATHWCGPPSPPTTDASAGLASPVPSLPSGVLANGSLLLLHAPRRINTKSDRRMSVPPAHGKGDHADPGSSYAVKEAR